MADTATFVAALCESDGMPDEHLWSHGVTMSVEDGALSVKEMMG